MFIERSEAALLSTEERSQSQSCSLGAQLPWKECCAVTPLAESETSDSYRAGAWSPVWVQWLHLSCSVLSV